jgi:hypothetical protein
MIKPIEKIFATEEIAKAVIALGFNEQCIGDHVGFKQFGEDDSKLRNKFIHTGIHESRPSIERKENMPLFPICPAPTWDQLIDWFREAHDIDIDVIRIRKSGLNFEYTVMAGGKLVASDRIATRLEALEKAMLLAIETLKENGKA